MTKMFATRFAKLCFLSASPLALVVASVPASAQSQTRAFDIPAQSLASAVLEFSRQADVMVVLPPELAAGKRSASVKGALPVNAAIAQLLRRTGLRAVSNPAGGYRVAPFADSGRGDRSAISAGRLARVSEEADAGSAEATDESANQDIVVTAQKREERLQEVPVPVTAVRAESLVNSNQLRLQDYFARIPGLALYSGGVGGRGGLPQLSIRGLTTGGFANPTVGVVIDDVPVGSPTGSAFGQYTPDLDPSDLSRIEVLRGPQGTLYGASSVGGLLKYVTTDPTTNRLTGRLQAGISGVSNGNRPGYSLRAAINVPLAEDLALRASGFIRRDAGYLQDATTGARGINETNARGGRIALLWRPSNATSIKLSALIQGLNSDRPPDIIGTGLGDLQTNVTPGLGRFQGTLQAYSAIVSTLIGSAKLESLTGYNVINTRNRGDFGVFGLALLEHFKTRRFTQEVRLSVPLGDKLEWLVGGYFNDARNNPREQNAYPVNPVSGVIGTPFFFDHNPSKFREFAAFTNLTVTLSDKLDIQFGARQSHIKQSAFDTQTFPNGSQMIVSPFTEVKSSPTTFLVTPRYRISPDAMVYARFSTGYRPGGPNPNANQPGVPQGYGPDKSQNYEIGFKGSFLDRKLSIDLSAYYISWIDLQTSLNVPSTIFAYIDNAGRAKSQGVELTLEAHPWAGMTLSGSGALGNAKLTQNFPGNSAAVGRRGDPLPYSPRFSGSISAVQEIPISDSLDFTGGISLSHVGDRRDVFGPSLVRAVFPSYSKVDLNFALRTKTWTLSAYINNLADKRGVLSVDPGTGYLSYITPRTMGVSIATTF